MGADSVRFKAEVHFDGREVARIHVNKLELDQVLKVCASYTVLFGQMKSKEVVGRFFVTRILLP